MSNTPDELRYTRSHEWVRQEDDGLMTVGITEHAQSALGDMVFVETPEIDKEVEAGDAIAVLESVKAAADAYAPVAGKIVEANTALADEPDLINSDPYGDGWIFRIAPIDEDDLDELMTAAEYENMLEEDEDEDDDED